VSEFLRISKNDGTSNNLFKINAAYRQKKRPRFGIGWGALISLKKNYVQNMKKNIDYFYS